MDIRQIAIGYIKTLSLDERNRVKDMLDHGIICGADYARMNGVAPTELSRELKLIFGGM